MKNYIEEYKEMKKVTLIMIVINIMWLFPLYGLVKQYIIGELDLGVLLLIAGMLIFISIIFSLCYILQYVMQRNNEKARLLKAKGIKVSGKIVDIEKEIKINRESHHTHIDYYAIVKYTYDGKNNYIKSMKLNFDPQYLITKDVDVYLYKGEYYIDNYKIDYAKMKIHKKFNNEMLVTMILLFIILFIAMGVAIYLKIL